MISVAFDVRRLVDAYVQGMPYRGITRYTSRLYREMKSRSDEVAVHPVYVHRLGDVSGLEPAQVSALDEWTSGEHVPPPSAHPSFRASLLGTASRLGYRFHDVPLAVRVLRRFQRQLRRSRFLDGGVGEPSADVFHSPVNPLPRRRHSSSRCRVLTVHDCIYLKHPELHPMPGRTAAIRKALNSVDLDRDYVICDSENTRRDLTSFLDIPKERTCVIPLAADEQFFTPRGSAAARTLSAVGLEPDRFIIALAQDEKRKNVLRLVEAFHRVRRKEHRKLLLVCIAGYAPTLRVLLQKKRLYDESVRIVVGVDDEALAGLLALATLFVYVPLYEGFGIPPLEAMAAGCPVVVANNSSIPEVVGDAGLFVDAEESQSIANGLTRLLGDDDIRAELASRGRVRAKRFSWQRTTDMTLEYYRDIVQRHS